MNELAIDRIEAALLAITGREVRNGTALCPARDDNSPSLSVTQGHDSVLLHCHAGCSVNDVIAALGLSLADLFDKPLVGNIDSCNAVIAQYVYQDAVGRPAHMVQRRTGKQFTQHTPNGHGDWKPGLHGCELFPYHLPELLAAPADTPIHICEGEKDVEAIRRAGGIATCNAGGAGKWKKEYNAYFQECKNVILVADKDTAGEQHARDVYNHLSAIVPSVRIVQGLGTKDAFDHLVEGHTRRVRRCDRSCSRSKTSNCCLAFIAAQRSAATGHDDR